MPSRPFTLSHIRARQIFVPLAIAATLILAACSTGSSSKTTATSTSVDQATTAATTTVVESTATSASTTAPATTTPAATSAPATTTAAAGSATSASGSADTAEAEALQKEMADALSNVKSYKLTISIYSSGSATPDMTGTNETVLPDKNHSVFTFGDQKIETLSIGDQSYVKLGDTWQDSAGLLSPEEMAPVDSDELLDEVTIPSSSSTAFVKKGEESLDGVKTDIYEMKSDDGSTVTTWTGQDDHLPRKSVIESATERVELIFSNFNDDFDIQAPN